MTFSLAAKAPLFFNHFLKLLLTLHCGHRAASSKARNKKDATRRRNQLRTLAVRSILWKSPAKLDGKTWDLNHVDS